jgi:hypothetical protein
MELEPFSLQSIPMLEPCKVYLTIVTSIPNNNLIIYRKSNYPRPRYNSSQNGIILHKIIVSSYLF